MNAYTTRGQAQIQQRDIDAVLFTDASLAAVSLAALERQRGYQADARGDASPHGRRHHARRPIAVTCCARPIHLRHGVGGRAA